MRAEPHRIGRRRLVLSLGAASTVGAAAFNGAAAPWWTHWTSGRLRGFTTVNVPQLEAVNWSALWQTGATLARVGMHFQRRSDARGTVYAVDAVDLDVLSRRLDEAGRRGGAVVVLGLFDDGVTPQPLWTSPALQDAFVAAWRGFGAGLARHPAVAGLDLLNEPLPRLPTLAQDQRVWAGLADRTIRALRQVGCRTPVVLEPVLGAHPSALRGMPVPADPAVVLSPHFYTPHDITHQGVNDRWRRRVPYPAGAEWGMGDWDAELGRGPVGRARLAAELRFVGEFLKRRQLPVYVGEFGCVRWAPAGSALRWVGDCVDLFGAARWNWSYHTFRGWSGWDAEVDSTDLAGGPRSATAPVMRRLQSAWTGR